MKKISLLLASALLILGSMAGASEDPSDKNPAGGGTYEVGATASDMCLCNKSQASILPNNNKQYNSLLPDGASSDTSGAPGAPANGTGTH